MLEQTRPIGESAVDGLTGLDDALATDAVGGMVTVSHGVHSDPLPVGNMTVGEIRRRYADRFEINPLSEAQIDGHPARDDEVVRSGQMLMFLRDAGEKGAVKVAVAGPKGSHGTVNSGVSRRSNPGHPTSIRRPHFERTRCEHTFA